MSNNEVAVKNTTAISTEILTDFSAFENAQRIAKLLMQSAIIPQNYQNNLPNTIVALEIAARTKMSPIVVMQNLNIIKGRPSWSSKYLIAALTTSKVNNLHYEVVVDGVVELPSFKEKIKIENKKCRAIATDKKTNEERIGPWVSIKMAVEEGWYGKDGSKWKTMPDMMLHYRAATFFASVFYPDLSVGLDTEDEEVVSMPDTEKAVIQNVGELTSPEEEPSSKPKKAKKIEAVEIEPVEKIVEPENEDEWNNFQE